MHLIRIIFILSLIIVFILSVVNANDIPRFQALSFLSDKIIHSLIYFYLTYLGILSAFKISKLRLASYIFIFGLFIEIIHFFHPYRFFEYQDLLANLIGVTIALLIYKIKNNISY